MKLKSLILGSVAAAGLSTGAFAADLGVLTSLDVCDALGLSGLTISSDTNCLQITGGVEYEFVWGDYNGDSAAENFVGGNGSHTQDASDGAAGVEHDWESNVAAWLKFVATADSDFGPAKAVIKLLSEPESTWVNEDQDEDDAADYSVSVDEAYVQIGDSTVIMAGKKGSIFNDGDDEPFNWLGLFNSDRVDSGVYAATDDEGVNYVTVDTGDHVIQVVSDLGNGFSVGAGLENLDDTGTFVGVMAYSGEGISAHASFAAADILTGTVGDWVAHAGFTGTFEQFRVRAAVAFDSNEYWNALASAEGTFDMFKLALSGEAWNENGFSGNAGYSVGASASATVTDGVTINLGARWFDDDSSTVDTEGYQVAASLSAAVSETLTLTGEVGVYGVNKGADSSVYYGAAQIAWAPGGGFTSSLKGEANSDGAYKATFKAAKSFE
jgi:hypothetical protein